MFESSLWCEYEICSGLSGAAQVVFALVSFNFNLHRNKLQTDIDFFSLFFCNAVDAIIVAAAAAAASADVVAVAGAIAAAVIGVAVWTSWNKFGLAPVGSCCLGWVN